MEYHRTARFVHSAYFITWGVKNQDTSGGKCSHGKKDHLFGQNIFCACFRAVHAA